MVSRIIAAVYAQDAAVTASASRAMRQLATEERPSARQMAALRPQWTSRRWLLGVVLAVLTSACGQSTVKGKVEPKQSGTTSALRHATVVPGKASFLIVGQGSSPNQTQELRPTQDGLTLTDRGLLPVDEPLLNVGGIQLQNDRWVLIGIRCIERAEVVDPQGCTPGSPVVAVSATASGAWRIVDDLPPELSRSFAEILGNDGSRIALEQRKAGASRYWVLDVDGAGFGLVEWQPPDLQLSQELRVDAAIGELQPSRTSCLVGGKLVVVDGHPLPGGMRSQIWSVDPTSATGVADAALDLPVSVVPDALMCGNDGKAHLVAVDHNGYRPVAYELAGTAIKSASPAPVAGPLAAIDYSPAAVAIQFIQAQVGTPTTIGRDPITDPNKNLGAVSSASTVDVAVFVSGGWRQIDGSVSLGEHIFLSGDTSKALIVSVDGRGFRLVGLS